MSWAHAAPTEVFAVFAEGAVFGALFLCVADDALSRLSRRLIRRRRVSPTAMEIEHSPARPQRPSVLIAAHEWRETHFCASNDAGFPQTRRSL